MNRSEFEALRSLPDKQITADIRFELKQATSPNLTFEDVPVENALQYEVILNGTFKPDLPSVTFNFVLRGVGPICRKVIPETIFLRRLRARILPISVCEKSGKSC